MRILTAGPTGVVAMQRVLDWMAARGEHVWVTDYDNQYRQPLPPGFQFQPVMPLRRGARVEAALRRLRLGHAATRLTASRVRSLARQAQPDVIHVHNIDLRGLACAEAGVGPLIVSAWGGLIRLASQPDQPLPETARRVVAACDVLVVDTPALLEPAAAWVKPGARVAHVPMGADTQVFRPGRTAQALEWRAHFAIASDVFVLLSPRMWASYYNHQQILRAYVRAFARFQRPTQLAFTCLGPGPDALPHMAAAWQEVAHTPAAATVRWLPRIRYGQMPTLYAMVDAVVNYPAADSFGATLVEAAACQAPLLTALLPTYRGTFVEAYATLVRPDDPDALAEAMVQVVNEAPESREPRLRQARQVVEHEYDDAVIQAQLWKLYAELAA
jgi:glycosyltransferase involved in cell wall biosynthesis